MKGQGKNPLVFLVCTGLEHINRGYESFTRECYDTLKDYPGFDLYLIKSSGERKDKEIVLPNLKRTGKAAKWLGKLFKQEAYIVEQFTFCLSLLPLILRKKPALIYYSDFITGTYLWHIRKHLKLKYKLLFSNGAPNNPPFKTEDHVQQLLPHYFENALQNGEPASKQTLLPYGFEIDINDRVSHINKRDSLRHQLGFTPAQKIILSVGAVNKHHKRMDYLINEVARLPADYFLVILGQFEEETPELLTLAESKLHGRHLIKNVPQRSVGNFYVASDYFVLASLTEGFGRVIVEALSYGLPCIVHDYVNANEVLLEHGYYIDMKKEGALSECLSRLTEYPDRLELIKAAYNLYSWDKLKSNYVTMISQQISSDS